ncbi:MAG: CobD/CbiB family protein [Burkholderiaceae bacterium]
MALVSLIIALLVEQLRALPAVNPVYSVIASWVHAAPRQLNAGRRRHGVLAWLLLVAAPTLAVAIVFFALARFNWLLALGFNVLVLYFTLGFRQFSHPATEIQIALANGDIETARLELTRWKREEDPAYNAADLSLDELVREAIEHGLLLAQRHVFGVLLWFVLLPGASGAVFYRMATYVAREWNRPPEGVAVPDRFGDFSRRAAAWIDWLPARMTALGFAVVGDFEGGLYCWRQVSRRPAVDGMPSPDSRTLILGTASGALGVRLMPAAEYAQHFDESDTAGLAEPMSQTLRSVVGLVWRAMLLWLALLALITVARWVA